MAETGFQWRVIGSSVHGASHARAGTPNQDAIGWRAAGSPDQPATLAVADGHGSASCVRSDRGARMAVDAALGLLQELVSHSGVNPSIVKSLAEDRLSRELPRQWRAQVEKALADDPLSEEDLAAVAQKSGDSARASLEILPVLAYGTTLLAAAVTAEFALYVQIGDGDILSIASDGVVERPIERDQRLIANETTSLCSDQAWKEVRTHLHVFSGAPPALILISSDGYSNSFPDEANFTKVGSDLLALLKSQGPEYVSAHLEEWLSETSEGGSGDDISVGLLLRYLLPPPTP